MSKLAHASEVAVSSTAAPCGGVPDRDKESMRVCTNVETARFEALELRTRNTLPLVKAPSAESIEHDEFWSARLDTTTDMARSRASIVGAVRPSRAEVRETGHP